MSSETSTDLKWHHQGRKDDGIMRHIADSKAWKDFKERYEDFFQEDRNIMVGLTTDGVSPFRTMNSTYSIWPVVTVLYNLPPWKCMKQPYFVLNMIISGPKGPGNNIDVYLQPLISELKTLWVGVETFDASLQESFTLRAALLLTITDYPALAVFSGRSTRGRYACPHCGESTCSKWLYHGKKFCYLAHRRWLDEGHPFRNQEDKFDGTTELRTAPIPLSGCEIFELLDGRDFTEKKKRVSGSKKRKRDVLEGEGEDDPDDIQAWKKKSIFFELPYWKYNSVRHVIDFMHTEKNIAENCVGTMLNEKGKSKDNVLKSLCSKSLVVEDIERLEKQAALILCHLEQIFPPSFFTIMVHLLIHLPYEAKLAGPVHYRWMYPIERYLSTLKSYVRNRAQPEGSIAEGYLAEECASFCAMYLEGVETRCSRLPRNPDPEFDISFYLFQTGGKPIGKVDLAVLDDITWIQAHRYVLFHHAEVKEYCKTFLREIKNQYRPRRYKQDELDRIMNERFHEWFKDHVSMLDKQAVSEEIKWLAKGPLREVKRFKGLIFNGTRYLTKSSEINKKTQNSGILVISKTRNYVLPKKKKKTRNYAGNHTSGEEEVEYYGVLTDIIELDYYSQFKVILFRGDWANPEEGLGVKKDGFGFKLVNFNHLSHTGQDVANEPFVLSSQVQQVFYVQDPLEVDWHVAIKTRPRSVYSLGVECVDDGRCDPFTPQLSDNTSMEFSSNLTWVRKDISEEILLDS